MNKNMNVKHSDRQYVDELNDDIGAAIIRLQKIREDLSDQIERINCAIDDLKRAREMAREIGLEEIAKMAHTPADNSAGEYANNPIFRTETPVEIPAKNNRDFFMPLA